ncbi:hypothetical protein HCN44_003106 [Aphidius gifuensis]|uniref:Uncharacterized protein n=1 Tax=Aphidius gifuensis TaxID=684658 RepID=A0A835CJZ7_APHGI|nr:hypothetical protein HCN44_003106 [Aphidius gifuensis]
MTGLLFNFWWNDFKKKLKKRKFKIQVLTVIGICGILLVLLINLTDTRKASNFIDKKNIKVVGKSVEQFISEKKSIELLKTNYSCLIIDCNEIICSYISAKNKPGKVASIFIEKYFKTQCKDEKSIKSLTFKNCHFPNEKLTKNWLTTNYSISSLTFAENELSLIEKNSFSSIIFDNLKSLIILKSKIPKLSKYIFNELDHLQSLSIQENKILQVDDNLFENIADTLETLVLDDAINNTNIFINMTKNCHLSKVQLLSLQRNHFDNLPDNFFNDTPNILSLYMDWSNIKTINSSIFKSTTKIQQIFLNNNQLTTLPANIFNPIIKKNSNLRITMIDNPWKCDCKFLWIKNIMNNNPNLFSTIPECKSPDYNIGLNFKQASFCGNLTSSEVSSDENYTDISCDDIKNLNLPNLTLLNKLKLPNYNDNFSIKKLNNNSILININNNEKFKNLIWFKADISSKINCIKNLKNSIILNNFDDDSDYKFCVLDNNTIDNYLNCLELNTKSNYQENWLMNSDKPIVWTLIISFNIFFYIIGGVCGFFLVRKYPTLLKGSKKVIMIKNKNIKALALSKGIKYDENNKRVRIKKINNTDTYLTPLERRRKIYNDDYYGGDGGDGGYETIKMPTRNSRISASISSIVMNLREANESSIPPTPPPHPRPNDLPILSSIVDYT